MPCFTDDSIKKKWRILRDTFRRELYKIPDDAAANADCRQYTNWPYFENLYFIKDHTISRSSATATVRKSMSIESEADIDSNASEFLELNQEIHTLDAVQRAAEHSKPDVDESDKASAILPAHKKRHKSVHSSVIVSKNTPSQVDEDQAFFNSLLPHVRRLSPKQKLLCRMRIQQQVQIMVYECNE